MKRSFTIDPTGKNTWRLTLLEDGHEAGFALGGPDDYEWLYEQGTDFVGEFDPNHYDAYEKAKQLLHEGRHGGAPSVIDDLVGRLSDDETPFLTPPKRR